MSEYLAGIHLLGGMEPIVFLNPSDGVFGRFDLAALDGCHTLNEFVMLCYVIHQHGSMKGLFH